MAFSVGVCLVSTLLCGLVPAVQASRIDVAGALKCDSGAVISGSAGSLIRSTLVVVQVSLSFVLLVGAGLLIQSLQRIRTASPGFSTQGVLTTAVNLFASGYDAQRAKTFQDQLIERVDALGGVQSAAYARILPFSNRSYNSASIAVDGYQTAPDEQPEVAYNEVSPGYFATMGIPLVSGREFTRNDDETAPLVAVVNQTMAAQYWKGADPVGKRVQVKDRWMQVVGVAKNSKYRNMVEMSQPFFYVALRQNFSTQVGIIIRTRLDAASLARAVAHEVHTLDPGLGLYEVITMREQVDRQAWSQQIAGMLLGMFGGLALLLATIGLYGVMSYAVSQSTRELGLRMALGAAPSHLLRLVMSRGLVLSATGVMLGAAAALASTRLLGYLLYNVSPRDTLSFGSALLVVIVASLAACFLPAWRATRTDPLRALRD
jgi:predicted permease